ncbi:NAD(P)/FAD-dependent oxidoreductase [Streptomyces sp. NRRL WC-3742]|uniref:NAD(P)/FAD-dependent oxidoreductase n=1 Tax=Streptomyces sp. NRRL WC-3742 TaxID=1463934 RepID=UPI00068C987F|nr:FAD-dependent oxidoreductase [Streptomyces sp. NRRL WC-3742]
MRIAVVGAGMAAARFAERYGALGGPGTVTLYGAEPRGPYNRVLLAEVLAGRYDAESIALPLGAAHARPGCEVVALDVEARTLRLADGGTEEWDELVLATGANPVLPPVGGLRRSDGRGLTEGVHTLRTLEDGTRLAEEALGAKRAVVIGGGVLGVSAARALAALGARTEIVHQAPYLIERHLDAEAAEVLRGQLRTLGVDCYPGNRARAVHGRSRVEAVELANGYRLDCDLVVLACGTRPRTALAHAAGLAVATGVLVDDALGTSAPHVHAVGDCAEHLGPVRAILPGARRRIIPAGRTAEPPKYVQYEDGPAARPAGRPTSRADPTRSPGQGPGAVTGLAAPAWDQADVLARRLSGADPDARYPGWRPRARLSTGGLEYAAFGAVDETLDPGLDVLRLTDATRGSYKKLVLRGDRLVGAILLGDLAAVDALAVAFAGDGLLTGHPLHLLTRGAAMTGATSTGGPR